MFSLKNLARKGLTFKVNNASRVTSEPDKTEEYIHQLTVTQ